ncbi:Os05g0358000, partial [Oryza sativa Japonica Group]
VCDFLGPKLTEPTTAPGARDDSTRKASCSPLTSRLLVIDAAQGTMPTGFVRDEAKGGKSGGVAPLRRPAAHVPCSFTARSASSKNRGGGVLATRSLRKGTDTGERWQEVL